MNKDSKLLAEAYEQVLIREGIIKNIIQKPLRWMLSKIVNAAFSAQQMIEFVEQVVDKELDRYKQYTNLKSKMESDPARVAPDDAKVVSDWEKQYKTPEGFKTSVMEMLEAAKNKQGYSEHEKQWAIKKVEDIQRRFLNLFEHGGDWRKSLLQNAEAYLNEQ